MKPGLLHLGPKGVITDPDQLLRTAFAHGWAAAKNQSPIFTEIFSFQYVASQYGHSPSEMTTELESALKSYLSSYFPEGCVVTVQEKEPGEVTRYTLTIAVRVMHNGESFELYDSLYVDPDLTLLKLQNAMP